MQMTLQYIQLQENKDSVLDTLEASSLPLFMLFNINFMKASNDKSHILASCNEPSLALVDGSSMESNTKEILLQITIDRDLKFDEHVNNLCKKACQNLNALVRLAPFMNVDKKRMIMKAFIESQFGYCPLVWMFHS